MDTQAASIPFKALPQNTTKNSLRCSKGWSPRGGLPSKPCRSPRVYSLSVLNLKTRGYIPPGTILFSQTLCCAFEKSKGSIRGFGTRAFSWEGTVCRRLGKRRRSRSLAVRHCPHPGSPLSPPEGWLRAQQGPAGGGRAAVF